MVGDVIASVLQRQRAETSLRRQNEFLSALQEVTLNLVSEREVEDLLRNILERAVQLTGASGGFIELAERGEAHLSLAVASGVIEEQPVRFSVRAGEGLTGRVWETGRPLTVANYDSWPGRIPDYPRGVIGSIVGVPLVSAGGVSGVVALVYAPSADRTFDPEVVGRLVPFARFAAIALENARAYATARRELVERTRAEASLQRALAFSDVMVRILSRLGSCASEEIDSSVVAALKETATFIGADHAYVIMISPDGTAYRATQEWCGPGVPDFFSRLQHVPFGTLPWSERQILNDEVILANSRDDYPSEAVEERSDALREGCLAVMNVPIRSPLTGVSGAVGVHSRSRSMTWRQEDIVRLRMVADVVGSVLERKRAEASLRESEENYRALSSRLISVEEEAKTSLARELHDGLGQALTALKMDVKWVGQRLASSSAALRDRIDRMNELVDDTIGQVRTVARSLRPALLDDLGLAAAVEWQVSEFGQRTGIETELSVLPGTLSLDGDRSTTVFRILQEALTNVVRHAEARRVRVELKQEGSSVILLVSDDGRGIPDAALADATSLGLIGMKERVRPWNGEIRIDRRPEGGTTVHVRLPVDSLEPRAHGTGEPT